MSYINPVPRKKTGYETPETKRIYHMIMKFIKFPLKDFHDLGIEPRRQDFEDEKLYLTRKKEYEFWKKYPNTGYFFTGCHWYGADQNSMAALLAFAAKFDAFDEETAGVSRETILSCAIKTVRYACFTHDTGPADCVRVDGKNKLQAKTKWGGNYTPWPGPRNKFFQSSQVGSGMTHFGFAVWALWEDLDEETRQMAYNVVTDYAERWVDYEPRDGTYYNTQAEENGWTALGLYTAASFFADDPRAPQWRESARRWMMDSGMSPLDMVSGEVLSDGKPLRSIIDHIVLHPDFTTENHGMVHPDYLAAPLGCRTKIALFSRLTGAEDFPGMWHNWDNIYEKVFKLCAGIDGGEIPIQGQDWWYYKIYEILGVHTAARLVHGDPYAAMLQKKNLDTIETVQTGHLSGTFMDNDPDKCIISPASFQTLTDMEPSVPIALLYIYLWHYCCGEGVAPVSDAAYEEKYDQVKHFPFGGSVVQRTENTFNTFSYRNSATAFVLPKDKIWLITTPPCASFGVMEFASGCDENPGLSNQYVIREMKNVRVYDDKDTFAASGTIDRGLGQVEQNVSFVALPDGNAVYFRRVKALKDCTINRFTSGLVGVRNENYKYLTDLARGFRELYVNDAAAEKMPGYVGGEDIVYTYNDVKYLSIDNKISYLLHGSRKVQYVNHHNYPKWKGVEDFLVTDLYENKSLKAGEELSPFVMVSLPNQSIEDAKKAYETFAVSSCGTADAVLFNDRLVYASALDTESMVSASFAMEKNSFALFEGQMSFKNGVFTWSDTVLPGGSGYRDALGYIASDRNFDAVGLSDGTVLIRYEGETEYHTL